MEELQTGALTRQSQIIKVAMILLWHCLHTLQATSHAVGISNKEIHLHCNQFCLETMPLRFCPLLELLPSAGAVAGAAATFCHFTSTALRAGAESNPFATM